MKIMNFLKLYEFPRNFMKIMKFMDILDFPIFGGPKTLIFLRNYWCFRDVRILAKIMIFCEIPEHHEIFHFLTLSLKFMKKSIFM